MGKTKIDWADMVWNPTTGCTKVSQGCAHCYAERIYERFHPGQSFSVVHTIPGRLEDPLHWKKPRRIFVDSMSDLFHEKIPLEFIADVFNVMASATLSCKHRHDHDIECWTGNPHTFMILTKRPERMRKVITEELPDLVANNWPGDMPLSLAMEIQWPLPNVWLGVSVEDQATADERIPLLLQTPAAVRFVSCEPLLSSLDLSPYLGAIQFVIVGCESGPCARPMRRDWARSLRDQCQDEGVPFFLKQMMVNGKVAKMPELDGKVWNGYPK